MMIVAFIKIRLCSTMGQKYLKSFMFSNCGRDIKINHVESLTQLER